MFKFISEHIMQYWNYVEEIIKSFLLSCPTLSHLYYKVRCVSVCLSTIQCNVRLTSSPVLMLWGTQGYLWLHYDLTKVIKLFGVTFIQAKIKKNFKKYFMSFLPHQCHSFCIAVIPSVLLSFLPDYCHSFRISVIPSELFRDLQILTKIWI